ncbi:MAG: hypothetical protein ACYDCQ_08555 [Dehalococcoidia bacterium]
MEPLHPGQSVTYFDTAGATHSATVVEAYGAAALVSCDLGNLVARRLQFEDPGQPYPYITDADGGATTEMTFEAPVAEE